MKRIAYVLIIVSTVSACSKPKSLSGYISSDSVEGINQVCHLKLNDDAGTPSGQIIESLNINVGGLHDVLNVLAPEILEESMLMEGDIIEFENSVPKLESGESFIMKIGCKSEQCILTDTDIHRLSNYTKRDSLMKKEISCLGIDMKVVTFKLSCLASSNCSNEETAKSLLNDFNWFEKRIERLKRELRELASTKDKDKLVELLKEQNDDLLSLVLESKDCLTINELAIELK